MKAADHVKVETQTVGIRLLATHFSVALLAFVLGSFLGKRFSNDENCNGICHGKNQNDQLQTPRGDNVAVATSLLAIDIEQQTPRGDNVAVATSLLAIDIEQRLATGFPWIEEDALSNRNGHTLLLRSVQTKGCERIDMTWLQSPAHQDDCLVILPHTNKSDSSIHHIRRSAASKVQSGQAKWNIIPWEQSLSGHKPFRLETPPKPVVLRESWTVLQKYFDHLPRMLEALEQVIVGIERPPAGTTDGRPITIMLSNKDHVDLLINFVCASRNLWSNNTQPLLDHIVVFAIDSETETVASGLGLKVFRYPEWLGLEGETAASYGSHSYALLMLAKIWCAHMMSALGYDFVFHDVDIVPLRRDYLTPLLAWREEGYDMLFQYDFPGTSSLDQMQPEYRPLFINSGLYFVRANALTRRFFDAFVRQVDFVLRSSSHQVAMTALISAQMSSHGLRVKVLRENADQIPGGFHFHHKKSFMQQMMNAGWQKEEKSVSKMPYLFHMNYNENKETKKKFNQQIGSWYLADTCQSGIGQSISLARCCVTNPEPKCFFKDKPSKLPCRNSPFLEEKESFW